MAPKVPIIDIDEIGKEIGLKMYNIIEKKGISQKKIAEKMGIKTPSLSFLLTGKKATSNLEQYWRIAQAIPISRSEFDKIVETAKAEVLGMKTQEVKTPDEQIKFALNSKGFSEKEISEMMNFIHFKESKK